MSKLSKFTKLQFILTQNGQMFSLCCEFAQLWLQSQTQYLNNGLGYSNLRLLWKLKLKIVNFEISFWCLQFSQMTNENNSTWGTIVVKLIFFDPFIGELKIPKIHFELKKNNNPSEKCYPIVALLVTYWLQFEKRTILRLSLQPTIDQVHTILCTGSNKKEKSNRVTLSIVKYRRIRSQIHLTIWTNWMIQFTNLNCRKKNYQSNLSEFLMEIGVAWRKENPLIVS